jgi:L-Lysine epsilon oxidase N-terminal/L-lysine epsilon oxidase C-terminal domain
MNTPPDLKITHAAIHPAIGIARLGNSAHEYFIGPEVPYASTLPTGEYKDKAGALKREVARFRIYGYNTAGQVVAELTPDNANIEWTVHLANKKAAWYEFQVALDIPEANATTATPSRRRNPQVTGQDRSKLIIDPGPRSIQGRSTQGDSYQFDNGKFFDLPVPLGELQTDEEGRLLVFGGHGLSRSAVGQIPLDFANNNCWHDDISDGPVEAKVMIEGVEIPVEPAWVVIAPPNYAPALKTVRTMHDLLQDCFFAWNWLTPPKMVSFNKHIRPIFERLSQLQWVNSGFASEFGAGAPYDFERLLERLADPSKTNIEFRQQIYAQFRNPDTSRLGKWLWPYFYGDGLADLNDAVPDASMNHTRGLAVLTGTQLGHLAKWARGEFLNDLDNSDFSVRSLDAAPLESQPDLLDEAALAYCLADAFHPGCELTWIIRQRPLFRAPLRIRHRPPGLPEPDYGDILAPDLAVSPTGPLSMSGPGDLTRWMAIPWQTDTASCLSGYPFFNATESLPTFWPARVPNQVLSEKDYNVVINRDASMRERLAAFHTRRDWFRGFHGVKIEQMITEFHKLGIIEERPGVTDQANLPKAIWVESKPDLPLPEEATDPGTVAKSESSQHLGRYSFRRLGEKSRHDSF